MTKLIKLIINSFSHIDRQLLQGDQVRMVFTISQLRKRRLITFN